MMANLQDAMIDLVPVPAADVATEMVEGEVLLYEPRGARAVYLNPTAALVFGLCDGKRSVRDIVRLVAEYYPDDAASLADDVLGTISELRESGVLVVD
jgi:pyrroloquinoline quinone biosynthesis protein D